MQTSYKELRNDTEKFWSSQRDNQIFHFKKFNLSKRTENRLGCGGWSMKTGKGVRKLLQSFQKDTKVPSPMDRVNSDILG